MDRKRVATELVRLARVLMGGCEKLPEGPMRDNCEKKKQEKGKRKRKAAVVYRVPFQSHAGQVVGLPNIKKHVIKAVRNYGVDGDIVDNIMREIQRNADALEAGSSDVWAEFSLPIMISKNRSGGLDIQFQT